MSRGINKVILIGNLGAEPEVRYMPSGGAVANISVATSDTWRDKQTGEMKERTEWHRVALFNRLGEIAGEYLHKGSKVYIEGSLRTRKWQGQDGQDKWTTEIIGRELEMLDGRKPDSQGASPRPTEQQPTGSGGPSPGGYQNQRYQDQYPPQQQGNGQQQQGRGNGQGEHNQGQQFQAPQAPPSGQDFDDDIPF